MTRKTRCTHEKELEDADTIDTIHLNVVVVVADRVPLDLNGGTR